MADGPIIGGAMVRISPDADQFEEELRAQVQAAVDSITASIDLGLNPDRFDAGMAEVRSDLEVLSVEGVDVAIGAAPAEFESAFSDVQAQLEALDLETVFPNVGMDTAPFEAGVGEVQAQLAALSLEHVAIDFGASAASADELAQSLAGVDVAGNDLLGTLDAVGRDAEIAAAGAEQAAGAFDALGAAVDAMSAGGAGAGVFDLGGAGGASAIEEAQIEVRQLITDAEDAGLVFDSLDELTNMLGMDLSGAAVDAGEFGDALAIALDNAALSAGAASEVIGGVELDLAGVFNSAEMAASGIDQLNADLAGVTLNTWLTWVDAIRVSEGGLVDIEGTIVDLTGGIQVFEQALSDIEGAGQDAEAGLNDAAGAGGVFINVLNGMGGGIDGVVSKLGDLGSGSLIIGAIVAAIITAIPVVAALIGEIGALSAIGFTAFFGIGAFALGAVGDLKNLETAAKSALAEYERAVQPFIKPVVNELTPAITDGLQSMIPIAESAAKAIGPLVEDLDKDMSGSGFKEFISWVSANTGPSITVIADFVHSVVASLAEMGEQGQPFIDMIEHGLSSFGTDLENFGKSNTFKDFVDWLVTNGPTVGGDIEQIAGAFGHLFVAVTPLGISLLNDARSAIVGIVDVLSAPVHLVEAVASGWDRLTNAIRNTLHIQGIQINDGPIQWLEGLNQGLINGGHAVEHYTDDLRGLLGLGSGGGSYTPAALTAFAANTEILTQKLGVSGATVDQMAKSLNINLHDALSQTQIEEFTNHVAQGVIQVDAITGAMEKAGVAANNVQNTLKAGSTAAAGATTAWASYGSAVTFFSNSVTGPTAAAIENFYKTQTNNAAGFANNIQVAIKDGYSPALIGQILQAGPAQAGLLLGSLVQNYSTGLVGMVNSSLTAMSKIGAEAVEEARITAEAVASHSAAFAADVETALAISQALTTKNAAAQLVTLASTTQGGLGALEKIALEYGNLIPQSVLDQLPAAAAAGAAQTQAVVDGANSKANDLAVAAYLHALAAAKALADQNAVARNAGISFGGSVADGVTSTKQKTKDATTTAAQAAIDAVAKIDGKPAGIAIINGMIAGLPSHQEALDRATLAVVKAAIESAVPLAGGQAIGKAIDDGIAQGLAQNASVVQAALAKVISSVSTSVPSPGRSSPAPIGNAPAPPGIPHSIAALGTGTTNGAAVVVAPTSVNSSPSVTVNVAGNVDQRSIDQIGKVVSSHLSQHVSDLTDALNAR